MEHIIKIELSKESILNQLDLSCMAFLEEWEDDVLRRTDIVSAYDIDKGEMSLIKYYWIGCDENDIEVGIVYEVEVEDDTLILNFLFYETYVEGFKTPVLFDIYEEDEAIKCIIDEWKSEFSLI